MKKCNFKDSSDSKNKTVQNPFDDSDIQACSATDCTGLIPSLPQDEAEVEAYEDLYPYITKAKNVVKTTDFFFYFRYTKNRCKKLLYSEKEIL